MVDISLHLLDLLENTKNANATRVSVLIEDDPEEDTLRITVSDNGRGMSEQELKLAVDPFYSSSGKKTGLGLPMVIQAAEMAGGTVNIKSEVGRGTDVTVLFRRSHLDRQPMGDPAASIVAFLAGNPGIATEFEYRGPKGRYRFDSASEMTDEGGKPLGHLAFLWSAEEKLREGLAKAGFRPD
ncbi:MAG TPA: sensor histidine kinase [Firmicutes bacterium]|nr:sensor histidine kinase [Candidatus Fermentithermobacillaceae bacterium]